MKFALVLVMGALIAGSAVSGAWAAATITGADIVDGTIQSIDIGSKQVGNVDLATDAVDGAKIKNLSIKNGDLGNDIVTSGKIKDGTILRTDMATNVLPNGASFVSYGSCDIPSFDLAPHAFITTSCPFDLTHDPPSEPLGDGDHVLATLNNVGHGPMILVSVSTLLDCDADQSCFIEYTMHNLSDETIDTQSGLRPTFDFVAWNNDGDHE